MSICKNAGQVKHVEKLFNECSQPDIITFNILISCHAKLGHTDRVGELFKSITKYNLKPDVITYTDCINSCVLTGNVKMAMYYFEELKLNSLKPNIFTFNVP
eukprot:UN05198